jgi:hypothetical protein
MSTGLNRGSANREQPVGLASWHGGKSVAYLYRENRWIVLVDGEPDRVQARNLAAMYSDRLVYRGPQDGHYGARILYDLAKRRRGSYALAKPGRSPRGAEH